MKTQKSSQQAWNALIRQWLLRSRGVLCPWEGPPGLKSALGRGLPWISPLKRHRLNELMSRTGDSPSSLFRKALGLYKLAEEANREGKAVGIASTPDALETEFVGL